MKKNYFEENFFEIFFSTFDFFGRGEIIFALRVSYTILMEGKIIGLGIVPVVNKVLQNGFEEKIQHFLSKRLVKNILNFGPRNPG